MNMNVYMQLNYCAYACLSACARACTSVMEHIVREYEFYGFKKLTKIREF